MRRGAGGSAIRLVSRCWPGLGRSWPPIFQHKPGSDPDRRFEETAAAHPTFDPVTRLPRIFSFSFSSGASVGGRLTPHKDLRALHPVARVTKNADVKKSVSPPF